MNKELLDNLEKVAINDEKILGILLPGKSGSIKAARDQILRFVHNPLAKTVMLLGPVGCGKSTTARIIALMRYLIRVSDEKRLSLFKNRNIGFDGPFRIDKRFLTWYEELDLPGLVETLAQVQLFGSSRRSGTGIEEGPGIFEQAMYGHMEKGKETDGAKITKGIVFLDEIGDLSEKLQPALLGVLTGKEVFRVGKEGDVDSGYTFEGVVVTATWRREILTGRLRPDLLSRLSSYRIELPGLNEREDEFEDVVTAMIEDIHESYNAALTSLLELGLTSVARKKIENQFMKKPNLNKNIVKTLKRKDWSKLADMRGLRQILEKHLIDNITVEEALDTAVIINSDSINTMDDIATIILSKILNNEQPFDLGKEIKIIENKTREKIYAQLQKNPAQLEEIARKTGQTTGDIMRKLRELKRDRSRSTDEIN